MKQTYFTLIGLAWFSLLLLCTTGAEAQESASLPGGAPTAPSGEPTLLHLPDGAVVVGYLLDHEATGIRFQVARHGGIVSLPWEKLHAKQSESLRKRFGYIAEEAEELLIPVNTLILVNGLEVIGVILEREGKNFVVKSGGNTQVVPKNRVASINDGGLLPALEVYKVDELYAQGLAGLRQDDAQSHVALAQYCERILDFPHAVQHYTQAVALRQGEEDTREWELAAERAAVKAQQFDQLERLREVDKFRRRNLFPKAIEKLMAFRATYPNSPLTAEANKAEALLLKTQERVVRKEIASRWFYRATQLTRKLARTKDATFDNLVASIDSEFTNTLRTAVTQDVIRLAPEIQPEIVEDLFRQRKKGRFRSVTYGSGTWLLGSDRAQAGLDKSKVKKANQPKERDSNSEQSDFQKRVEAYLTNQKRLASAGLRGSADQVDERNLGWAQMSLDARAAWLLAYYAEFSGVFEARPGIAHLCRQCGGTGALESLNTGLPQGRSGGGRGGRGVTGAGGPRIERCTLCHGEQIVRKVRYR